MNKTCKVSIIKTILFDIFIALIGCLGVIFTVLYVDTFESGVWLNYSSVITAVSVSLISILTVLTITFSTNSKSFVYKLFMLVVICISITITSLYFLKTTGFLNKIDSVEKFREYISSFGNQAILWFTIIQFLQVVVLPIPAFITVGAGVLLFGPLVGAIFSSIGIILGSIVAFYIGRIFGFKVAKWLVGEDSLNKGLKIIKGKDKIILTFMFLFPFFPDDILCFVAGITTLSSSFFITMIIITRLISVFASSYSMNNSIIPYDTWWGILLWGIFIILTLIFMVLICKKGDKIQKLFTKKKKQEKD
ncbi:MAG: TVP38/TMEM64 family protein [Clostridiales bacterium]|nr:TVP38/TMEM64 family protein [Clostridiales bacterium]